jgi:hypothetical protein
VIRLVTILVLVLAPALAYAGDEAETVEGKAHFADGSAAFARGDFATASREFAAGYAVEPWSGFLFAWAQAERSAGACTAAIDLYKRFIATQPPASAKQHAIGWIEQCGGTYVEPPPVPSPKPAPPPSKPPVVVDQYEAPAFPHKLAVTLGGLGLASGLVSLRFYLWSRRDFDAAAERIDYVDAAHFYDRGRRRTTIALVSGGLAVGLVTGAIVRFALHRRTAVDIAVTPSGVEVAGRF